jgi:cell division initiation protein
MRLTPIEIRQHRFSTRLRGFDPGEVHAFLEAIVADYEVLVRENAQLRREIDGAQRNVEALRSREHTIQETLATAQNVVDQLKRTAVKESEVIVGEAEIRADRILREAEEKRAHTSREIIELRHIRNRVETDLRKVLDGYLSLIESFREIRDEAPAGAARELAAIDGGAVDRGGR